MTDLIARLFLLADSVSVPRRGKPSGAAPGSGGGGWTDWVFDPKNSVFAVLLLALLVGGGRKLLLAHRGRRSAERLGRPDATPEEILDAAQHGRAALPELFALLDPSIDPARRHAAGQALAILWAGDELIAEEEKGIVTRGFAVDWRARRRYPRALAAPIPIEVRFGVPFLVDDGPGIKPADLDWSCRMAGSRRASVERFGPWTPGPGRLAFTLEPADFADDGPHRLSFQAKAQIEGVTTPWELDLPHIPFSFEFDPRLEVDSILAPPDESRAGAVAAALRLDPARPPGDDEEPRFLPLGPDLAIQDPPTLHLRDLPCDLAHRVEVEVEGRPGLVSAGHLIACRDRPGDAPGWVPAFDAPPPPGWVETPGEYRLRLRLTPEPHRAWADPDVRSLWPGEVVTGWAAARVVRL